MAYLPEMKGKHMKLSYDHPRFDSLSRSNIDQAIQMADSFLTENHIDYEQRTVLRLTFEDLLLAYRQQDENAAFEMIWARAWHKITVFIRVKSESFNVLEDYRDIFTEKQRNIFALFPEWKYRFRKNTIRFELSLKKTDIKFLKMAIGYMASEKRSFGWGVLMRALNILILTLEPWLAARIIEGITSSDFRMVLTYAVLVLMMEVGSSLFTYFGTNSLERAYHVMIEKIRNAMTENVLQIKTEHIDTCGTGIFTERIISETYNVANGIHSMVVVLTELIRFISLMVAFATISAPLMAIELALFLAFFLIIRIQAKKKAEDSRRVAVASEAFSSLIGETVRASRDIKLLHCEDSFLNRAKDVIENLNVKSLERRKRNNRHSLVRSQFIAWSNLLYLVILVIMMTKYGLIAASALVLYNYNGRVFSSAQVIADSTDAFYSLLLSAERVCQIIDSSDFSRETFGEKDLETVRGEIELKDISFTYRHKDLAPVTVLKDLNLRIPAGQTVALVGSSGCGKTTILSLISQLYDPDRGSITLDGTDTRELTRDTVRNSIGMVSQSPYLFNMSIRDNFKVTKMDASDDEIAEVCRTACIHDDIMKLKDGYDTVVGEGGCMLSGGQRQRIALARALLKDYPVIMLDEATSALDNETQATIRDAIHNMHGKSTVIMIAHRLSTVINCEQLFFIDEGRVLAAGTHEELLENCEAYRRLYAEECS